MPWRESPLFKKILLEKPYVVDVGFGGGFPLLPLAREVSEKTFFGIDARRKKVDAVREIARLMKIDNIRIAHLRLEDIEFDREVVLLFRAVGKIQDCLRLVKTSCETVCFFYKGPEHCQKNELEGWNEGEVIVEDTLNVPGMAKRMIVGVRISGQTKNKKAEKATKNLSKHPGQFSVLVGSSIFSPR